MVLVSAISTLHTNEFYSESTFTGSGTKTRSNYILHIRDSMIQRNEIIGSERMEKYVPVN